MTDYYVAKPEFCDKFYGSQHPYPVTAREIGELAKGWDIDEDELNKQLVELDTSDPDILVRINNSLDYWDTDILDELARMANIDPKSYDDIDAYFIALQTVYPALSWFNEEFDWYKKEEM